MAFTSWRTVRDKWRDKLLHSDISGTAKLVGFSLSNWYRPGKETFPALYTIGSLVGLSERTVSTVMKELISAGLISKEKERHGKRDTYTYTFIGTENFAGAKNSSNTIAPEISAPANNDSNEYGTEETAPANSAPATLAPAIAPAKFSDDIVLLSKTNVLSNNTPECVALAPESHTNFSDLKISEEIISIASEKGFHGVQVEIMFEEFKNHYQEKGKSTVGYLLLWKKWVDRETGHKPQPRQYSLAEKEAAEAGTINWKRKRKMLLMPSEEQKLERYEKKYGEVTWENLAQWEEQQAQKKITVVQPDNSHSPQSLGSN